MQATEARSDLPQHIAIIPDGNRRWAQERGLPSFIGHQKGLDRLKTLIDALIDIGVPVMTFWGFSTENWKRSTEEVSFLMRIFEEYARKEWQALHARGVRVRVFGNLSDLPTPLTEVLREAIETTKNNTTFSLNLCLSYGGRDELLRAVKKMITAGRIADEITEETFAGYLDSAGLPDPDLVIRTSGEQRLSGLMPWQTVYSELYFVPIHFPDFTPDELKKAITWFQDRQRRFGK